MIDMGSTIAGAGAMQTGEGGAMGGSTGTACHAAGNLRVSNHGITAFVIDDAPNPTLTLCRGSTYVFA